MCGRYGFSVKDAREMYDRFEIVNTLDDYVPRWNIAPGQMNPVIVSHSPNQITKMFWGLIPSFAKDENYRFSTINAKAETVAELVSYRRPFRRTRCLIPATGFYEPDKLNFTKPPHPWHYFQMRDGAMFGFAGIYDIWKDKESGKEIYSYAIITTPPNELVGLVHHRMPAILRKEDEAIWLNPDQEDPEVLLSLLQPYPADLMKGWKVGNDAKRPANEGEKLIIPIDDVKEDESEQTSLL